MNKQAYYKLMKVAEMSPEDDKTYTSSVNALAALLSGAGVGTSLLGKGQSRVVGGALTGTGIGGAAAYHLARLLKAGSIGRMLSALAGGTVGGITGAAIGAKVLDDETENRPPVHYVRLLNDEYSPVIIGGNVGTKGYMNVNIPNTVHTSTKVRQD